MPYIALYLCASGSFERSIIAPMKSNEVVERVSRESDSTLGAIYSLLNLKIAFKQKKENLLKCPVDYTVYVTKGSFNIFGNTVSLPINGTGELRINRINTYSLFLLFTHLYTRLLRIFALSVRRQILSDLYLTKGYDQYQMGSEGVESCSDTKRPDRSQIPTPKGC